MLSGVGAREELSRGRGRRAWSTSRTSGKHLKDHLQVALMFPAAGIGVSMTEIGSSLGPDALRAPAGPLPADPADDVDLPRSWRPSRRRPSAGSAEWFTTGKGLASSSLYDACAWFSTGLGDEHTHDAQIGFFVCGYTPDIWETSSASTADGVLRGPRRASAPTPREVIVLANPVQPHSEGSCAGQRRPGRGARHRHELLRRPARHRR